MFTQGVSYGEQKFVFGAVYFKRKIAGCFSKRREGHDHLCWYKKINAFGFLVNL